jgi:hypothetical protein
MKVHFLPNHNPMWVIRERDLFLPFYHLGIQAVALKGSVMAGSSDDPGGDLRSLCLLAKELDRDTDCKAAAECY